MNSPRGSDNTTETIVLGGGCFWCLEASYQLIKGVVTVTSGYAGGSEEDADYYAVSSGKTKHAEVVQVIFDPNIISLSEILDIFWAIHDPTTLNQQGNDVGPQYRSAIFYTAPAQFDIINTSIEKAKSLWDNPITTTLQPLEAFYPAEEYHQNYFNNHPDQAYCQIIINPKLAKVRDTYQKLLR